MVLYDGLALLGRLEADHRLDAWRRGRRIAVAPGAVIAHRALLGLGLLAHCLQLLWAAVAAIGMPLGEQDLGDLAMARRPRILRHRLAVPVEAEPGQPIENGRDGLGRRTFAVGVLDAQKHLAARFPGKGPVEEGGPAAANMKKAGWRR